MLQMGKLAILFLVPLLLIMIKLLNDQGVLHLWKNE